MKGRSWAARYACSSNLECRGHYDPHAVLHQESHRDTLSRGKIFHRGILLLKCEPAVIGVSLKAGLLSYYLAECQPAGKATLATRHLPHVAEPLFA